MTTTTVTGTRDQVGLWDGSTWTSGAATVGVEESLGQIMGVRWSGFAEDFLLSGATLTLRASGVTSAQLPARVYVYARTRSAPDYFSSVNPPPLLNDLTMLSDVLLTSATITAEGTVDLELSPSLLGLNTVRYAGGFAFLGFGIHVHARTADGTALTFDGEAGSAPPTLTLTYDTRTFSGIQLPIGYVAHSVPDLCPICGDETLRETWTWCGFHRQMECPNCADPEDRREVIPAGRHAFIGGFGSSGDASSLVTTTFSVTDTDTIDLTLVSNVLTAAIIAQSIRNAQIATDAAIARSKLASGSPYRLVVNNASGVMADADALTASSALATDANGIPVAVAGVSATEVGYLANVTSDIQTQINALAFTVNDTGTIDLTYAAGILSAAIVGGSITNAEVNVSAAIALSKLAALAASRAVVTDVSGVLTAHANTTPTEIGYVNGVTSAIQTQLDSKITENAGAIVNADVNAAAAIARSKLASGNNYRIVANDSSGVMSENAALTANEAVATDANGQLVSVAGVSATEVGYLANVTSDIQTQINAIGGDFTLLQAYNPSGAASVDMTSVITSTYTHYLITFNLRPATDGVLLYLRTDSNNGASFEAGASDYAWQHADYLVVALSSDTADSEITLTPTTIGNATNEGISGHIHLYVGSATHYPSVEFMHTSLSTATGLAGAIGSGCRLSAATINAAQLLMSSGNLTGAVRIYGLADS